MDRRYLLKNSLAGLAGLGAMTRTAAAQTVPLMDRPPALVPIRAHPDRIYDIKCCLRPFRTKGPNLSVEHIGDATVIHNYGHYGSGWCLSWGSADMQVQKAMSLSPKKIAVIGSGIIGLTSALVALRAGVPVTIYARELLPRTRSYRANGVWGPGTVALASDAPANLGEVWEKMVRTSWKYFRPYMGRPGNPIAWVDHYTLSDTPFDAPPPPLPPMANGRGAAGLLRHGKPRQRPPNPRAGVLTPDVNPFPVNIRHPRH